MKVNLLQLLEPLRACFVQHFWALRNGIEYMFPLFLFGSIPPHDIT